jgi:hypothetical protein
MLTTHKKRLCLSPGNSWNATFGLEFKHEGMQQKIFQIITTLLLSKNKNKQRISI